MYGSIPKLCAADGGGELVDELMSGWLVKVSPIGSGNRRDWLRAVTHYGYEGCVAAADVRRLSGWDYPGAGEFSDGGNIINARSDGSFARVNMDCADLLCEPLVRARVIATLYRHSIVKVLDAPGDGWAQVRLADGRVGYMRSGYLSPRLDDDEFFLRGNLLWQNGIKRIGDRDGFRKSLVDSAMSYLGKQYRWGGKSPVGVDCSGFVFLCYMENGVLIYRDARICAGYPVHSIPREKLMPGDLIYWEGHVGMYLGQERYIHATANQTGPFVTVNSLNPEDGKYPYRADLAENIKAFGTIF